MVHSILAVQHPCRRSDKFVFANEAGNRETHMLEKLKVVCKKVGVKNSTVHALRHSFGAHLRMKGVSIKDIADLMGHGDMATTQIYAKVEQERLREMITRLSPRSTTRRPSNPAECRRKMSPKQKSRKEEAASY